jgi:hypothetical protein
MTIRIKISLLACLLLFLINHSHAQRFGAALLAGPNISQVQGDELAGYHKLGITGGLKGITYINETWNVNIELLFTQKGSRNDLVPDNSIPRIGLDLNYVEVPIYAEIKDWEVEDEDGSSYSKVSAHAGFSYGRLISSDVLELPDLLIEEFKNNDFSYLVGLRFQWNKHWAVSGRYSRSILSAADVEDQGSDAIRKFYPYSIAFRLEYVL